MKSLTYFSILAASLLSGEVPAVAKKAPPVTFADIGNPPSDPLRSARAFMQTQLKDPYSAQYILDSVYPAYCKQGWARGGGIAWKGWAANVRINARNSYGGYGGYESYTVLFTGEYGTKVLEGENFGAYGPSKGLMGLGGGAGVCDIIKQ